MHLGKQFLFVLVQFQIVFIRRAAVAGHVIRQVVAFRARAHQHDDGSIVVILVGGLDVRRIFVLRHFVNHPAAGFGAVACRQAARAGGVAGRGIEGSQRGVDREALILQHLLQNAVLVVDAKEADLPPLMGSAFFSFFSSTAPSATIRFATCAWSSVSNVTVETFFTPTSPKYSVRAESQYSAS